MQLLTKEPERISSTRIEPNFYLHFAIDDCPQQINIAYRVQDSNFIDVLFNLFKTNEMIIKNKKSDWISKYPEKSQRILNNMLTCIDEAIKGMFINVAGLKEVRKAEDGLDIALIFGFEAIKDQGEKFTHRDGAMFAIKCDNFHIDAIRALVKIYREACEAAGTVSFIGPKSIEQSLDNQANRLIHIVHQTGIRMLDSCHAIYRGS